VNKSGDNKFTFEAFKASGAAFEPPTRAGVWCPKLAKSTRVGHPHLLEKKEGGKGLLATLDLPVFDPSKFGVPEDEQ